ncbi:MAG: class I SAM-dependent methyltransferase [bacterium]|nr:class I SAM-dependent methyltransferase [bacterium]
MTDARYIPALRFRWLTRLYDPLLERWTASTQMRQAALEALDLGPGLRLLELGCGPGRLAIEIKRRQPTDITRLPELGTYDRVYSTLVFHHLSMPGKQAALAGVRRSLSREGHTVVADFGRPKDRLQWLLFSIVGWADGIENTRPHRNGRFDHVLREAFGSVRSTAVLRTIFGTVEVFVCRP